MTATWKNGHIILDAAPDWPDGCRLSVEPAPKAQSLGIRDEDWPTDPEGIARLLGTMDQVTPLEITQEEEADFWAWKKKMKEY